MKQMKQLVEKQVVNANDQMSLLTNELVVIVPSDSKAIVNSEAGLFEDGSVRWRSAFRTACPPAAMPRRH